MASNYETLHETDASAAHFLNSITHNQMFSLDNVPFVLGKIHY